MAKSIAAFQGTALRPGISRNGRFYTREIIARAVARAQTRLAEGEAPMTMLTHHGADDDSTHIAGRLTGLTLAEDGSAKFTAELADTHNGRVIRDLIDTKNGKPFLRGVSIRGAWIGQPRQEIHDGQPVETADDLELDGLDFTRKPGVPGALIDNVQRLVESFNGRTVIYESVQEALVTSQIQEAAAPLKSGGAAAPQTKASTYADPGYQPDKAKRYALDTKAQAKAAWSYIHQADNAKPYTGPQLKRIKQRIKSALKKFGVEISTDEGWLIDRIGLVTETEQLAEHYLDDRERGSFCISLSNGPINISVSSYCVDPADLDLIGKAAMAGAVACLASIDPDMDGDMDVPGADAEDTDGDMGESADGPLETAPATGGTIRVHLQGSVLNERDLRDQVQTQLLQQGGNRPAAAAAATETSTPPAAPAEGTPDPGQPAAPDTTTAAPDPAADPHTETEEPVVTEPTTTAVETAPAADAAPAAPAAITLSMEQFEALLARTAPAAAAPAAPAAAAPAATEAAPAPAAQVTEAEDQRIARIVEERVATERTRMIQDIVESGRGPGRKGLVSNAGQDLEETDNGDALPESWPQKPLHKYTAEERQAYFGPQLDQYVMGNRALPR